MNKKSDQRSSSIHSTQTNSPQIPHVTPGMPKPLGGFGSNAVRDQVNRPASLGNAESGKSKTTATAFHGQQQDFKPDRSTTDYQRPLQANRQDGPIDQGVDQNQSSDNIWAQQMRKQDVNQRRGQPGRIASMQSSHDGRVGPTPVPAQSRQIAGQPHNADHEVGSDSQSNGKRGNTLAQPAQPVAQYIGHGKSHEGDVRMEEGPYDAREISQGNQSDNAARYVLTENRDPAHRGKTPAAHARQAGPSTHGGFLVDAKTVVGEDEDTEQWEQYQHSPQVAPNPHLVAMSGHVALYQPGFYDNATEIGGHQSTEYEGADFPASDNEEGPMISQAQDPVRPQGHHHQMATRAPPAHATYVPQHPSGLRQSLAPTDSGYDSYHNQDFHYNTHEVYPGEATYFDPPQYADTPMHERYEDLPQHQSFGQNQHQVVMIPRGGVVLQDGIMSSQGSPHNVNKKSGMVNRPHMASKALFGRAPPFTNQFSLVGKIDIKGIQEKCKTAARQYTAEMIWDMVHENNAMIINKYEQYKSELADVIANKDKAIKSKKKMTEKYREAGAALKSQATSLQVRTKQYSNGAKRKYEA